jgi:hypothetical protein
MRGDTVSKVVLLSPFILTGLFVVSFGNVSAYDQWLGLNGFTLWNCLPLLLATFIFTTIIQRATSPTVHLRNFWPDIGLAAGILGSTLCVYLSWKLDWWEARTGSSTSGLVFIFAPLYEFGLGFVGFGIGCLASKILPQRARSPLLSDQPFHTISIYVLVRLCIASALVFGGVYLWAASQSS